MVTPSFINRLSHAVDLIENRSQQDRPLKVVQVRRGYHEDADVAQPAAPDAEAQVADHQIKIAMAAYFIAEKRGFEPGHELEDWVAAEAETAKAETPSVLKPIHPSPARSAT